MNVTYGPVDASGRRNAARCVYFAYDRDGRLLYVGQTSDLRRRLREHRSRLSLWWQFVVDVRFIPVDSLRESLSLEASMIRTTRPLFNKIGMGAGA